MGNCILTKSNVGIDLDLLWTNPNPTSTFSGQTLQLDLTNYNIILIIIISSVEETPFTYKNNIAIKGQDNILSGVSYIVPRIRIRKCSFDNSSITFSNGYNTNNFTSYQTDHASSTIPYKIYGIKGKIS